MTRVSVFLKSVGPNRWSIYGPKGNQLAPEYRGSTADALKWAQQWISCWYNWDVILEENDDEKEDRLSK